MRWPIPTDPEQRSFIAAIGLSLAVIFFDNWAAPALHNDSPFWALGYLLALLLRSPAKTDSAAQASIRLEWTWRVALFFALHSGIIVLTRGGGAMLVTAAGESTVWAGAIASLKLLVVLPTPALFPLPAWRRLAGKYKAELIAAALVLFTWNPFRLFETVWPHYSEWLGRFVYAVSGLFVAGLGYAPGTEPTLIGPKLDVSILFACSGLNGVKLFQVLFGVMLLVDWNRLKKIRALAAYFAGLVAMLVANAVRIALLVVLGNRVSADLVVRFHIDAGWVFFTGAFFVFLVISYRWLLGSNPATPGAAH